MASTILLSKNFNVENISFDELKKNSMGGNVVYMKYNDQKITYQTPVLTAPFGLSTYTEDKTGMKKFSIDASFRDYDIDPKINMFYQKMCDLDKFIVEHAVKNSKQWFGKKHSKEIIENFYRPLIKESKQPEKYAPTIKLKIQTYKNGNYNMESYDQERNKVNMDEEFKPGAKFQAILELGSVWFVNKTMFGVTFRVVQLQMFPMEKICGYSFQEDEEENENLEETTHIE